MELGALLRKSIALFKVDPVEEKKQKEENIEDATVGDILLESQNASHDDDRPSPSRPPSRNFTKPIATMMGLSDYKLQEEKQQDPCVEEARRHAVIGRRHLQYAAKQVALANKLEKGPQGSWDPHGVPTLEESLTSADTATVSLSLIFVHSVAPPAAEILKEAMQACIGLRKVLEAGLGRLSRAESQRLQWTTVAICQGICRAGKFHPGRVETSVCEHAFNEAYELISAVLEMESPEDFDDSNSLSNELLEDLLFEIGQEARRAGGADAFDSHFFLPTPIIKKRKAFFDLFEDEPRIFKTVLIFCDERHRGNLLIASRKFNEVAPSHLDFGRQISEMRMQMKRTSSAPVRKMSDEPLRLSRSNSILGEVRTINKLHDLQKQNKAVDFKSPTSSGVTMSGVLKSHPAHHVTAASRRTQMHGPDNSRETVKRHAVKTDLFMPTKTDFDGGVGRRQMHKRKPKKKGNAFEEFLGDEDESGRATEERLGSSPKLLVSDPDLMRVYKISMNSRKYGTYDREKHMDVATLYENAKLFHSNTKWVLHARKETKHDKDKKPTKDSREELLDLQMEVLQAREENTRRREAVAQLGRGVHALGEGQGQDSALTEIQKKMGAFKTVKKARRTVVTDRASFSGMLRGAFSISKKAQNVEEEEEEEMRGKSIYEEDQQSPSPRGRSK